MLAKFNIQSNKALTLIAKTQDIVVVIISSTLTTNIHRTPTIVCQYCHST